jgi:hypothetical protein
MPRSVSAVVTLALLMLGVLAAGMSGSVANAADAPTDIGVTVDGPVAGSSVSVDQTSDLIHQRVDVSWKGFEPSTGAAGAYHKAVRIYQCQLDKANPTDVSDPTACLGNNEYGTPLSGLADGPPNDVDSYTGPDGSGSADVEVRTPVESSKLDCATATPCALVVVPAWEKDGDQSGNVDDPANWKLRTVIPIAFQELPQNCQFADADVRLQGSPLAGVMMSQWNHKTCIANPSVNVDYTNLSEPRARANFLANNADVALTNLPASADDGKAQRIYTYAPVNVTSLVVAFVNDDATTGQTITEMKLNPRLLAKLITASYGYVAFNGKDWSPPTPACPANQDLDNIPGGTDICYPPYDTNVTDNPPTIFADPEFLKLNPGHDWTTQNTADPLLFSGSADFTYELTQYIQSDAAAREFLAGKPDDWGMHVNTAYKGITYPANTFELRDPSVYMTYSFQPLGDFTALANYLVQGRQAGVDFFVNPDPDNGGALTHLKFAALPVGQRGLIAIIDSASAAALRLPTAQLLNAAGSYVGPTSDGMTAATADMKKNADGITRSMDYTAKDAAAYPLTLETYAMVATSKLSSKLADKTADLLDYAAGPGQTAGLQPGQLPPGYVPLAAAEVALTKKAADEVRKQQGATTPPVTTTPSPAAQNGGTTDTTNSGGSGDVPFTDTGSTDTGGAGSTDSAQPSASTTNPAPSLAANKLAAEGVSAPGVKPSAGFAQLVLPLLLLLGLVACGVGPVCYLLAKDGVPNWMKSKPKVTKSKPPATPPSA